MNWVDPICGWDKSYWQCWMDQHFDLPSWVWWWL